MIRLGTMLAAALVMSAVGAMANAKMATQTFTVLAGAGAHDVYPAPDGAVWFTAQSAGKLGRLDPRTGKSDLIALGPDAAPHGVIVGPDGAAWVTEGGQNAIARVDPATRAVKLFPLPRERRNANLNTATFDRQGMLWFTGQNGLYGRLDPKSGTMAVFDAPRGTGPYGIATTPDGQVFFASLAGNYLGRIDLETGTATVLEPPVPRQGARRVWSDSRGALWITGWNSGDLFRYDSKTKSWGRWHLPGDRPQPYAVYVDDTDAVWVSDWGANAILRFDPKTEKFESVPLPDRDANVRQLAAPDLERLAELKRQFAAAEESRGISDARLHELTEQAARLLLGDHARDQQVIACARGGHVERAQALGFDVLLLFLPDVVVARRRVVAAAAPGVGAMRRTLQRRPLRPRVRRPHAPPEPGRRHQSCRTD